ncbi:hypothetical protein GCM10009628_12580 [Paeniglutamicibacter kerguelensis]
MPTSLVAHDRYRGLAEPEWTEKIRVEDGARFFLGCFFYRTDEAVPGIVHEHIQPPKSGHGLCNSGEGTEPVANVELLYKEAFVFR